MNLKTLRKSAGITQQQLANKSGIHRVTIARIESNNHTTTTETAAKLATALGCTMDELIRDTPYASSIPQERT